MNDLQAGPILQSRLIDPPWALRNGARLPGTGPIGPDDWLRRDDAFDGQMALRDRLIADATDRVHRLRDRARPAAQEILQMALDILRHRPGYETGDTHVTRPDGLGVRIDRDAPLLTLGRLVQEDIVLLQPDGGEHAMTGAVLCFPASWTLDEKIDRPLTGIHEPVDSYSDDIARRVQRLFDAIRPGHPIVRANCLLYDDAALFQPRREAEPRVRPLGESRFVRSERQCLLRLPETGAVAFTIHTTVVALADLPAADRAALAAHLDQSASHQT
ncbi:MAG: DUF3445 domain-containing protein [Rhodobacter sp.]|nr:DUF3445 domain-containing protein [Rhodobacter sp.]